MRGVHVINRPGVLLYASDGVTPLSYADGATLPAGAESVLLSGKEAATGKARAVRTDASGRPQINLEQWLASTAPTVGQKVMASSIPVVLPSDQVISITEVASGTPVTILSTGVLATSASVFYEYVVPVGQTLRLTQFYTGGVPSNSSAGAVRAILAAHVAATVAFVSNGDFESAGQVAAWAAVTGAFTAPSPDSNGTQFQTGAASMRWIYTSSATAHERKQTLSPAQDMSGYRYIRVKFFNDAQVGTTRTITLTLATGTSTRAWSLSGTLGSAPFPSNTWVTLECDLANPQATTGTNFDITAVDSISLKMLDGANKSGTVYWDTVRFEDQLTHKHKIYSADGTTIQIITAPESYAATTALYLITKNTNNVASEYATAAIGTLS
jgi:hypothetical protein